MNSRVFVVLALAWLTACAAPTEESTVEGPSGAKGDTLDSFDDVRVNPDGAEVDRWLCGSDVAWKCAGIFGEGEGFETGDYFRWPAVMDVDVSADDPASVTVQSAPIRLVADPANSIYVSLPQTFFHSQFGAEFEYRGWSRNEEEEWEATEWASLFEPGVRALGWVRPDSGRVATGPLPNFSPHLAEVAERSEVIEWQFVAVPTWNAGDYSDGRYETTGGIRLR